MVHVRGRRIHLTNEQTSNLQRKLWDDTISLTVGKDNVDSKSLCSNPNHLAWRLVNSLYDFLVSWNLGRLTREDFRRLTVMSRKSINETHNWNGTFSSECTVDRYQTPKRAVENFQLLLSSGTLNLTSRDMPSIREVPENSFDRRIKP